MKTNRRGFFASCAAAFGAFFLARRDAKDAKQSEPVTDVGADAQMFLPPVAIKVPFRGGEVEVGDLVCLDAAGYAFCPQRRQDAPIDRAYVGTALHVCWDCNPQKGEPPGTCTVGSYFGLSRWDA
jgi:hypothetical protein